MKASQEGVKWLLRTGALFLAGSDSGREGTMEFAPRKVLSGEIDFCFLSPGNFSGLP